MKNWNIYRLALSCLPARGRVSQSSFPEEQTKELQKILRRFRCAGAVLCAFDGSGPRELLCFGLSHRPQTPAGPDTVFRTASVSKFVTGMAAMKLWEEGKIDLDADVNRFLPFSLRHPGAPDTPLTLRMLMSHTAGIRDGADYNRGVARGAPLSQILRGDSFAAHLPGARWEYSNLGAGIAGAVLEGAMNMDFEALMQRTLFEPLGVEATFYPQKVRGDLADALRILPPGKTPNFHAAARRARPLPAPGVDPESHYALAHGNLCASAPALARLGAAALAPGFLSQAALDEMRKIVAPFGARAKNLSQGLFTFVLQEPRIGPRPLFGHQGMAYGAVHGLFFDPLLGRGLALLTTGASEARQGVLSDINLAVLSFLLGEKHG